MPALLQHEAAKLAQERWQDGKNERSHHEQDWEELAVYMRGPSRGGFVSAEPGRDRNIKALTSAPIIAQMNFSAGLYGTLVNPANKWMGLELGGYGSDKSQDVREWEALASRVILNSFKPAISPFYSQVMPLFHDISTFGNACDYDELEPGTRRIMDVTLSLAEVVYFIDAFGRVVELVRRMMLKPAQAADWMGYENLPPKLQEKAQARSQDKHAFFQHVGRNREYEARALGPNGRRYFSRICTEVENALIRTRGYDEMPFRTPRWDVDTGQTYGYGPGSVALPDGRIATRMDDAVIRSAQFNADPVKLAPDREVWPHTGVWRPGSTIYGAVNAQGNAMIRTIEKSPGVGLTQEQYAQRIENVKDAFFSNLMQLAGRSGMSATEVIERQEEKLRLMAPNIGRIQDEYLSPKIARRFQLLWRAGQIPPPPEGAKGRPMNIVYQSGASMAQKSAEGAALSRLLQDVTPLVQMDPEGKGRRILDRINADDMLEAFQEARGADPRVLRSRQDADQAAEARQPQQDLAAGIDLAQGGARALRDVAAAEAAA